MSGTPNGNWMRREARAAIGRMIQALKRKASGCCRRVGC